ncbi:MAG: ABC transporter permease subunit [Proteobacteria bacterium]|nr:ABC transporter permease subunit [Pseudomonadota bacterium]
MGSYLLRRLLLMIPTILGIVLVCFGIMQVVPGGPVELAIQQMRGHSGGEVSSGGNSARNVIRPEQIEELKKLYGFDKPAHVRLIETLKQLFTFEFGDSFNQHKDVTELILDKLPVSITLGIPSLFLTYLLCIPLGIAKARRPWSRFDNGTTIALMVSSSVPSFVLGILLLVLFGGGSFWALFPVRGLTSDDFDTLSTFGKIKDYIWHATLPVLTYTFAGFAGLTLLTRNWFLDELQQLYVQTAMAKGASEQAILYRHVFRNAMILVISGLPAACFSVFFAGSIFVEQIFSLDGIGLLTWESTTRRDYPVVMGMLFITSLLGLLLKIISDFILVLVDPRINLEASNR